MRSLTDARTPDELTEMPTRPGQSTVSWHLACLRDCGLIASRAEGRASSYSLSRPELLSLIAAAEILLSATGDAVMLCPTYGEQAGQ